MKRYIRSSTSSSVLSEGAYLMDRDGILYPVILHAPSTTFIERGIHYLVPTDAEFLLKYGFINTDEAICIALHLFVEYLEESKTDVSTDLDYSMIDVMSFMNYAEMKYAPSIKQLFLETVSGRSYDDWKVYLYGQTFDILNEKHYKFLCNRFVKVYRIVNVVEFRINSTDGFDWNKTIIDKCILSRPELKKCVFEIAKQEGSKVKFYFRGASLNDILEADKTILSSESYTRQVDVDGKVHYEE